MPTSQRERLQRRYLAQTLIALVVSLVVLSAIGVGFLIRSGARDRLTANGSEPLEITAKECLASPPPEGTYVRITNLDWKSTYSWKPKSVTRPYILTEVWVVGFADDAQANAKPPYPAFIVHLKKASDKGDITRVLERSEFVGYIDRRNLPTLEETESREVFTTSCPDLDVNTTFVLDDETPADVSFHSGFGLLIMVAGGVILVAMVALFAHGLWAGRRLRKTPPPLSPPPLPWRRRSSDGRA